MSERPLQLIETSQCSRALDFKPIRPWPAHMPPIAHNNFLITGFESRHDEAIVNHGDFVKTFKDCYANLSLPELTRFYFLAIEAKFEVDWDAFFHSYHYRWNDEIQRTLYVISQAPTSFQQWLAQKQVTPQELVTLNWYFHQFTKMPVDLLSQFNMQTSRSTGIKILEMALELLATNHSVESVFRNSHQAERWAQSLHNLRYPRTHDKDLEWKEKVQSIPWPRHVDAQWKREGDQAAIEVKFSILNPDDFDSKINQLNNIKNKIERLWNPN